MRSSVANAPAGRLPDCQKPNAFPGPYSVRGTDDAQGQRPAGDPGATGPGWAFSSNCGHVRACSREMDGLSLHLPGLSSSVDLPVH